MSKGTKQLERSFIKKGLSISWGGVALMIIGRVVFDQTYLIMLGGVVMILGLVTIILRKPITEMELQDHA